MKYEDRKMKSQLNIFPIILVAAAFIGGVECAHSEPPMTTAHITVNVQNSGVVIPKDFLGFSFEKKILSIRCFTPENQVLINMFRNLGEGVLRVGANEGDVTLWSREQQQDPEDMRALSYSLDPLTLGPRSVDNLYGFSRQTGWRVIHGLNLGGNNAAMAADELDYALEVGGEQVHAFEIGNEPNLFPHGGLRTGKYGYKEYREELRAYHDLILATHPKAPLCGPSTTRYCDWIPMFLSDFGSRINLVTSHGYCLSGKETNPDSKMYPSMEKLLLPQKEKEWIWLPKLEAAKAANHPWRLDEYNSATSGGRQGLSDTFGAALWNLDLMLYVAMHGGAGMNLHGHFGRAPGYSPFFYRANEFHVSPIYYSLLMFGQAAHGQFVEVHRETEANLSSYAILGKNNELRLVLINKDLTNGVTISVPGEEFKGNAKLLRLTAPAVEAKEGIKLGGMEVRPDGGWEPIWETIPVEDGRCKVTLPPASAGLLILN